MLRWLAELSPIAKNPRVPAVVAGMVIVHVGLHDIAAEVPLLVRLISENTFAGVLNEPAVDLNAMALLSTNVDVPIAIVGAAPLVQFKHTP
jgi:hypothetical protein